jgi:hypothetical protein
MAGYREGPVRMLTLTSPAGDTVERSYAELRPRWKVFRERLRRTFPGIRLEYFAVTERQQRGAAHLHVLFRGGYLPQVWLSRAAAASGFGPIADVRKVGREAARYVAKYLAKEMADQPELLGLPALPKWHRRATWSRGWAPHWLSRAAWRAKQQLETFRWYLADGMPLYVALHLRRRGYVLVDVDYGDRPPDEQAWELGRQAPFGWRPLPGDHRNCWLCQQHEPAARRPHHQGWQAPPLAQAYVQ